MSPRCLLLLLGLLAWLPLPTQAEEGAVPAGRVKVMVIPLQDEVAQPMFYVLRRGLKEAIDAGADAVVLDLDTPGGALDATFDIMEAIGKFPGTTLTFINDEALSAGAFISATTEEIWFAPTGVIGAAAPVLATGQDVDTTMNLKITSYLKARMRSLSEGKAYRGEVISAMIDPEFELEVDGKVIKGKGELLSLTATEASQTYGDPPQPLLAAGMAQDLNDLLTQRYGAGGFEIQNVEVSWSENLATVLNRISALLLGLGLLSLYIEFKTPGFGFFGVAGIVLLGLVFLGNQLAGLSGHEPMLVFLLGVLLVFLEIFFLPGVVVVALTGVVLMLGSLLWSMADLWPNEPVTISSGVFTGPLINLALGLAIAVLGAVALIRFLPHSWVWDRMILQAAVAGNSRSAGSPGEEASAGAGLVGREGVAVSALRPGGQIEIDGARYEARLPYGSAEPGEVLVVRSADGSPLEVEKLTS